MNERENDKRTSFRRQRTIALREGVEGVLRHAEVERQHVFGRHVDPVRDREGAVLRKGAVVKGEDEVAGQVADGLDRVTVAPWGRTIDHPARSC